MSSFNPAVLKQLLEQFVSQEQLILSDLESTNKEIKELESKIQQCKARITSIHADNKKILDMKDRYSSGNWISLTDESSQAAVIDLKSSRQLGGKAKVSKPVSQPSNEVQDNSQQLSAPQQEAPVQLVQEQVAQASIPQAPIPQAPIPQAPIPQPQVQTSQAQAPKSAVLDSWGDEEEQPAASEESQDDANLKSINDALRQLFR